MRRLFVCPIKTIIDEIEGSSAYYILCSVEEPYENDYPNSIAVAFLDTEVPSHPRAFTQEMANQIIDFFKSTPSDADVFVCCDSGESRSAAIAAALMRSQGLDDQVIWQEKHYHPNIYVYSVMCKSLDLSLHSSKNEVK